MITIIAASLIHLSIVGATVVWTRWKGTEQVVEESRPPTVSFERKISSLKKSNENKALKTRCDCSCRKKKLVKKVKAIDLINPAKAHDRNHGQYEDAADINVVSSNIIMSRLIKSERSGVVNILVLISDTGGGHRASAQALETAFQSLYPGKVNFEITDIFSEYATWPFNSSVSAYQFAAKNPIVWRVMYESARFPPSRALIDASMDLLNFKQFKVAFQKFDPDMILSIHPLTQRLPIKVAKSMSSTGKAREIPFVTVVTDLGGAHPTWFDRTVDKVFVPSEAVMRVAFAAGLNPDKIYNFGLPTRPAFWSNPKPKDELRTSLMLDKDSGTVLVVGGGDGVGGLKAISLELIRKLSEISKNKEVKLQVVIICGKNAELKNELDKQKAFHDITIKVLGFVKNMDEWMGAVDVLVTKAGPGTIAEATVRGLPIMISSFLPGQEEGNVPFVVNGGFGAYSCNPKEIAETVSNWLLCPELLRKMSAAAKKAARPTATFDIAREIGSMIFPPE